MTSLNLGKKFDTSNVTNMEAMFFCTGYKAMTSLDLGPAFTHIPDGDITEDDYTYKAYASMFSVTGKSGSVVIQAPESIFQDKNNFKLNSSATTGTINFTRGTITPKYRVEWVNDGATVNTTNKSIAITLRATTNPEAGATEYISDITGSLSTGNIKISIDGTDITSIVTKSLGTVTQPTNSKTGAKDLEQTLTISNLEEASRRTGKSYLEWSGNIKIEITQKTTSDKYGNKNVGVSSEGTRTDSIIVTTAVDKNTSGSLFVDTIKPEFTYVYSSGNIDKTNKTLTVEFSATDKFFSTSTILNNSANITVKLLDTDTQIPNANITKTLTKTSDVTETRDGKSVKIGEKYKLVIGGLEEASIADGGKYRDYSGPMSITIPANLVSDKSGNKNVSKTITIGVNEPGGSSSSKVTVDVVDPLWKTQNINIDKTNKKVTVDLVGTDKYYKSNSLTIDKITVYVDGEEASTITKSLSGATSLTETRTVNGTSSTVQYGVKYTLTLSNWQESSKQTGKDFLEWSGTTKIKIAAGTLTDNSSNTSKEATFELGHVDFIKPEIVKVSSTVDKTAKTETIIFNLYDKYLFKDTYIDKYFIYANNISVYIDGESATGLTKTFTKVSDIAVTGKGVIGQQYKLVLSNFEQSTIASGKEYKDYSGTVSIEIAAGVVKDTSGNTNDKVTITGDLVDFIAPAVIYRNTDLEKDSVYKSVSMIFEVTDKYYSSENKDLQLSDLTIKIDNKIIDNSSNVTRNLRVVNLKDTIDGSERIIGKCYWLTLSGLEQLQIKDGDKYLDYSGVITVAIPASKAKDDSSNQNTATTITTGIDLPESTGTAEVVDVVAPHIEVTSLTVDAKAKTGAVTIQATDKYFASSTLSTSIDVYVNGTKSTSVGKTITSRNLTETRSENGTTSTVQYGQEVTLTLTNIPSDSTIKQVKLLIPEGAVLDKSGNKNKETSIMLINKLKATNTETYAAAGFLGNTNIAREKIETVTFVDNLDNVNSTAKDVSAQGDGSILSWYDEKTSMGGYQQYDVYIGSDYEIFANSDSSYLFACLGSNDRIDYTKKETIVNIDLLNTVTATNMDDMFYETGTRAMEKLDLGSKFDTSNVTSMNGMFYDTGNNSMTDLNLGSNFDTSNVTSMRLMFERTGYTAMTSLKLGSKFDTSKVTDMSSMFFGTGHTAMTSLNLGDKFNTSNVTTMDKMFLDTGYEAMTSLNLGDKFDTSNVTDMSYMFYWTGYTAMTSLNLGDKFDTRNVTDMLSMFNSTGYTAMTSLDLGDKFYTSKVTNMSYMFNGTGRTAMTSLDLGPAFTNIASTNKNMFTLAGKSGSLVVYAPEAIYSNKTNFKLNTSSSTTVALSTGTINAKYRIEWQKEAATVNTTNKSIAITLRATTNPEVDSSEYTSDVTGSLAVGNIKVLIDGTDITSIVTKSLGTATQVDNTRTGAKDVTYTLTLSKLEEASRRTGKNYKEWSGNITIQVSQGTAIDKYGNKNTAIASDGVRASHTITTTAVDKNTSGSMFVDTIQPEFTYVYSSGNIDKTNKTLTVEFSVTDKYFSTSTILNNAANITVKLLDTNTQIPNANITKTLTKVSDVTETRSGSTTAVKIGEKYKLVIGGLEETNIATGAKYRDYSGPMSITIPANLASDKSGNKNVAKTITIGVNEPGGSSSNQQIVDVADPMWQAQNINIDKANKRVTVDLIGTDKYYKSNSLTTDKITVYVDGEEASTITKNLSQATSLTETRTINGTSSTVQYGVKYTLTLSGWQEDSKQTAKGKSFLEWSGTTKIKISAGTITDQYTNTSKEQEFTLGHADFIKPEIVKVSSSADKTAQTETIVFNVVDKYLDSTKTLSADNILVYVDREATTGITKTLTKVSDLTATVNGSSKVVGQQYKLVLSSFKKTRTKLDSTRNYTDWSGTVSIDVKAGAVLDTSSNTNDLTTVAGDFVDYIKPEITYNYAEGDIDYTNKTFTMKIDAVDKYFSESAVLTTANLKNYLTIKIDGVDITNNADVTKEIIATENITAGTTAKPINKTINGTVQTGLINQVVGKRYTLKLSNLEQVIKTGDYLNYSGVVTVAIKDNPVFVKDTSSNTNVATTITSGLTFPGTSGTEKVVDVVDPLWEQLGSATAEPKKQTASIVLKGTDKYLNKANSNLTTDKIKVVVNGVEQKSGITVKVTEDTSVTMTYGKQYNVYVSGFVSNAYQVKIVLLSGSLVDNSGNKNKEQEFVLYSCLKKTNTETSATSPFLGNSKIQRQKIEKIIFEDEANYTNSTRWDVSAQEDGSIIAWYETTSRGTYIVHIGSSIIMNGNVDSSYLFANIGRDTACAETSEASNPIIENIGLLHVDNVTNMSHMFEDFGYSKMKTFSLGDGFDTSSVTDMSNMFNEAGYTAMTTITFGSKFTTKNVTNMSRMLRSLGYTAMGGLTLPDTFDTSKATNMSAMFANTGYEKMTTLSLSNNFDTSKVTDMSYMFANTGYKMMKNLDLKSKFDTSSVKNMEYMFSATGYTLMTSLDLKDKFYTTSAENMSYMFSGTGAKAMTVLDLGVGFTKIASQNTSMFANCGTSSLVIYAPELIYSSGTSFKLGK